MGEIKIPNYRFYKCLYINDWTLNFGAYTEYDWFINIFDRFVGKDIKIEFKQFKFKGF